MKIKLLNIYLLFSILFISCSNDEKIQKDEETININNDLIIVSEEQFNSSNLQLGKIDTSIFESYISSNGSIDVPPKNRAQISSYFGGNVKGISLLPGNYVKKGQKLFVLENPEIIQIQKEFLESKSELNYLESDYERQKELREGDVSSKKNYLKAETEFQKMKIKYESLYKTLKMINIDPDNLTSDKIQSYINIFSPISGYISDIFVSEGYYLSKNEVAMSIFNTEHLHLELNIYEKDLPKIKKGQKISFNIQGDNQSYLADVHLINRNVNEKKRTISVHGHLLDEKNVDNFAPGMYINSKIFIDSLVAFSLPQNAIVENGNEYYGLLLSKIENNNYYFEKVSFKVGLNDEVNTQILNYKEFKRDAEFLIKGTYSLISE
jgi:cobalt-zinc-cadmium efflux system membrane fusion protein